jgi:DNA-binding response OmpR family regulator
MKILVVEDDVKMAELLRRGLSSEGHAVTIATDGVTGLAEAQSRNFEVVLLDIMLPGLDGLTIAKRLHLRATRFRF